MTILDTDNIALYPKETLAALNRLETLLARLAPGAKADQALRLVPGKRAVFQGQMAGRNVVFRLPLDAANRKSFAVEWSELTRAWRHMAQDANRVAEPLFFDPGSGLIIIAHIPGTPLLTHLWSLETAQRLPLIARAAEWLHAYMAPTITSRSINRRPWRTWAAAAATKQPYPELADTEARILTNMRLLARQLDDPGWRVAIPHGDFHFNNLILSGDTLTGIDTGGSNRAPIYKDIARALTHMTRRGMLPSRRRFGVDADAFDAFATTFGLSDRETNAFLPYMIAYETLIRVEHPQMSSDRIAHALAMSEALLDDLRQIT